MKKLTTDQPMTHEFLSNQYFPSSAFPLPAFSGLVGGKGLSEQIPRLVAPSDSPSPPTSHNIYDGQLRPVAEYGPTGTIIATYVYATHINVPDYIIKGATTYRVITDHLGSLRFIIDVSTGTIAQRMDYDDWGNVITNTNADFTPFGFAGGMYDSQTKLTRFGARDYDPETGRWTSKDPIGLGGGHNLFAYIENDPLNYLDSEGKAQLCYRRFDIGWVTPLWYASYVPLTLNTGHCYIKYSDGSTSSYIKGQEKDIGKPDPLSNTPFQLCVPITGLGSECCDETCLKGKMAEFAKEAPFTYLFPPHNCCDAARHAIHDCKCKEPFLLMIANYGI